MMLSEKEDTSLSNYDQKDILSNLSSEISLDTINQQIDRIFDEDEPPRNSSDVFESFIQKYKFLKEKYKDNEEFIPSLEQTVEEIIIDILNNIENKFDFKITFSESLLIDDKIHYIHMIYNFLINYIEDGIESLFYNYFIDHIKEFPNRTINTKDQTYINFKGIIPNEYLNQIYNFLENIETIKEYKLYAEDLIELMIANDPMIECNFWCTKIFIDNDFVDISYGDNFKKNILDVAFNSNKIYKVQNLIIKKYCNK
jgi:hypothetical protein